MLQWVSKKGFIWLKSRVMSIMQVKIHDKKSHKPHCASKYCKGPRTIFYAFASENANSGVKCKFKDPFRKGLDPQKVTETRLKLVGHDIRIIAYPRIMKGMKGMKLIGFVVTGEFYPRMQISKDISICDH